jgi:hypothetical protein
MFTTPPARHAYDKAAAAVMTSSAGRAHAG